MWVRVPEKFVDGSEKCSKYAYSQLCQVDVKIIGQAHRSRIMEYEF